MFTSNLNALLFVLLIIVFLAFLIGSCAVVASVARRRGRNEIGWIVFSFFALPLAIILLLCLGETDKKRKERLEEEALILWQVWDKQNRIKQEEEAEQNKQEHLTGTQQMHSDTTINDMYRKK